MDRAEILRLLAELGGELERRGLIGDLYVVGGAAIALAFDARRSTRDIDAIFSPKADIYAAAAEIGDRYQLPEGWLNDAVKGFLLGPDPYPTQIHEVTGLRIEVASPQMVLVLKCLAHRVGEDEDDVRLLARLTGLATADQVLDLVERTAGTRWLTPQVRFFVEAVLDEP